MLCSLCEVNDCVILISFYALKVDENDCLERCMDFEVEDAKPCYRSMVKCNGTIDKDV